MFKKNALIVLMIVVLLCSVNAVSAAAHYSYIHTQNTQGNCKLYNGNGAMTMNWNFGLNNNQRIVTDGWRRMYINPLGWFNPNTEIAWAYVPTNLYFYARTNGGIGVSW